MKSFRNSKKKLCKLLTERVESINNKLKACVRFTKEKSLIFTIKLIEN